MGSIVNEIYNAALEWQAEVVWIRMNVAYVAAEVEYLRENDIDVADIEALMEDFAGVHSQFCSKELNAFILARRSETIPSHKSSLIDLLGGLRNAFHPWLQDYNALVEKTRGQGGLKLSLLQGCGAELFGPHTRFKNALDQCIREQTAQGWQDEEGAGEPASPSPTQSYPRTVDEAVALLLQRMNQETKDQLASCSEADLVMCHMGLGMYIRNEFGLWKNNPELLKSASASDADAASTVIIRKVWMALKSKQGGN